MKTVLVIGMDENRSKIELIEQVFQITYDPAVNEYHEKGCKIVFQKNLHEPTHLIDMNTEMRTTEKVVCFDTLNPRPETLLENIKVLNKIFSRELKKKLFLVFLNASQNGLDLETMRNQMLEYNSLFEYLNISSESNKKTFLSNKCWLIDRSNIDLKKSLQNHIEPNHFKYLLIIFLVLVFIIYANYYKNQKQHETEELLLQESLKKEEIINEMINLEQATSQLKIEEKYLVDEKVRLVVEIDELKKIKFNLASDMARDLHEKAAIKRELSLHYEEMSNLTAQKYMLQKEISKSYIDISLHESKKSALNSDISSLLQEKSQLESHLGYLTNHVIKNLKYENDMLKQNNSQLEQEIERFKS